MFINYGFSYLIKTYASDILKKKRGINGSTMKLRFRGAGQSQLMKLSV